MANGNRDSRTNSDYLRESNLKLASNDEQREFHGIGYWTDRLTELGFPPDEITAALSIDLTIPGDLGTSKEPAAPSFLDCTIDREKRTVTRLGKSANFSTMDVTWRFFLALHDAGPIGLYRNDLIKKVWKGRAVANSNCALQKSTVLDLCGRLGLTIDASTKGVWKLALASSK
jgi:hypothetical protein